MFVDTYVSIKDATISIILNIAEKIVCLNISSFMFSLPLSFIIDLYSLIPLIESANRTGIKIMFWRSMDDMINTVPFFAPSVATMQDILYPSVKPR